MQVKDLSKELKIQNKDLIAYLKSNDFNISSHMQSVTDEMIDLAREHFATADDTEEEVVVEKVATPVKKEVAPETIKTFSPDDVIPCKSVVPFKLNAIGADRDRVYHWEYYGDVDYVAYKDLQAMRRKAVVTDPQILIMDADLCYQWRRELGNTYSYYLNVEVPEEFFDLSDDKFQNLLTKAPSVLKDVIKTTAMSMIRNQNYPSINKVKIIDEVLGTCIMDFLN